MVMSPPRAGYQGFLSGDGNHIFAGAEDRRSLSVPGIFPGELKNPMYPLAGSHRVDALITES